MKLPYNALLASALVAPYVADTNAFVLQPAAIRPQWTVAKVATATAVSRGTGIGTSFTPLAASVEANGFIISDSDRISEEDSTLNTALADDIDIPAYLQQEAELAEFDLSDSIVAGTTTAGGGGISLEKPSLNFARVLILAASAVYGTNFAMVKMLDEQMPFTVSASLRFGLAAAVVSVLVLNGEGTAGVTSEELLQVVAERGPATWAGMEIGGWYCLAYLCQAVGLQTADASKSAFFNALAVIVVPLLDSVLRGKQMGMKGISSVALAIAGVGLLQLGPSIVAGTPMTFTQGDAFCLGQAALFGMGYWRLEQVSSQYASQAGRITVGQLLGVALGSTMFCGLSGDLPTLTQLQGWLTDQFTLGALVWTALVSTALALYLETVALKAVSAAELTVLMTSVSLFGSAFAFATMGETMSPIGMAGGLLILAGCVFSSAGEGSETSTSTAAVLKDGGVDSEEEILNDGSWLVESFLEELEKEPEEVEILVPTSYAPSFANGTSAGLY